MKYSKNTKLKVFLNNEELCVGSRVLLKDLLVSRSISNSEFSVAVNNRIIAWEEWSSTMLNHGDKVTVVARTNR